MTPRPPLVCLALLLQLPLLEGAWAAPVVVLDPGHGGSNRGALGASVGIHEKHLTLLLARRVASYLTQWIPGVRVELTRDGDEYLTLRERVRRANRARADCFASIHFNASESRSQRGFETFLISRDAAAGDAALVVRENERERPSPLPGGTGKEAAVRAILSDLQQSAVQAEAVALGRSVQRRLVEARGEVLSRGLRQAPFDVLVGLEMPGVLVEVGFIDHPVEGKEMADAAVREGIAAALAAGIAGFLLERAPGSTAHLAPATTARAGGR